MSYIKKIRDSRARLSKSFSKLADFILDSYIEAAFMTATDLAQRLELDAATVVRFSQHLGYSGYPELLKELRNHVKDDLMVQKQRVDFPDSVPGLIGSAMDEIKAALEQTLISLDHEMVNALVEKIGRSQRILVVAEGQAQPTAYNLVQSLELGNFPIKIVQPGLAGLARALYNCTNDDLLIAIDIAGEVPYLAPALREARGKGVSTAALAGSPSLPSTHSADFALSARTVNKKGAEVIAIEALIYVLMKALHRAYPDRFEGAERTISELSSLLQ